MLRFNWKTAIISACVVAASATVISVQTTDAGGFPRILRSRTSIEKLAHKIDELQEEVDQLGTVVVKQPDVWGEARLTAHRAQYERILDGEAENFKETIQANLRRSDQAFLLQTLALQAALNGQQAAVTSLDGTSSAQRIPGEVTQTTITTEDGSSSSSTSGSEKTKPDSAPTLSVQVNAPDLTNATVTTSTVDGDSQPGIALEPVIKLDQLSRYLNHLNQLRRINEGDDTADAPGYSMNLMRFPVSVLPGTKTREGYGAEVTVSVTPCISDKLLASTFQSLVINDLLDTLTLGIVKLAETQPLVVEAKKKADDAAVKAKAAADSAKQTKEKIDDEIRTLETEQSMVQSQIDGLRSEIAALDRQGLQFIQKFIPVQDQIREVFVEDSDFSQFITATQLLNSSQRSEAVEQLLQKLTPTPDSPNEPIEPEASDQPKTTDPAEQGILIEEAKQAWQDLKNLQVQTSNNHSKLYGLTTHLDGKLENRKVLESRLRQALANAREAANKVKMAQQLMQRAMEASEEADQPIDLAPIASKARHSRYPVSATQLRNVFGVDELKQIALAAAAHVSSRTGEKPGYHNIRAFLGEEFDKAWRMLARAEKTTHYSPWQTECSGLANAIRLEEDLTVRRAQYRHNLKGHSQLTGIIEALGWAILVDSALLDLQIAEDIERVAAENGNLQPPGYMPHFWGSHPTPDAVCLFRDYVASRWPIHVFAIDPVTQDQNVADSFSSRREIQLTLSVALASGQINAQEYLQYARRLETELDTITLNRTVVGFSHGTDTFGWRFQPRIQTPPTPSNARVFFNELLIGGPSRDSGMRTSMLEAGTRECVAVVLMPSILNQVNVDFRSSWYRLDKPHSRRFDLEDSVSLGQEVVELQALCQQCFKDKSKYRHGDLWRLEKAVNQLEKQLPLQNSIVHVPTENTLGGTQLFEGGQTSLGPELIGFYGQPGVHKAKDGDEADKSTTTLFLVGRNFSVTGTKVIAAGQRLGTDNVQVISREVLQVTIPAVREDKIESDEINLHVATPYGVSHRLKVPVAGVDAAAAAKKASDDAKKAAETAAETAISNHVGTAHAGDPSTITWKVGADVKTEGKIVFDNSSHKVKSFDFDNSAGTELKLTAPKSDDEITAFTPGGEFDLSTIEVAFWVKAFKKEDGKDAEEIGRKAAGVVTADQITNYGSIREIVDMAVKGITKLNTSSDVKYLEVEAFVRRKRTSTGPVYAVPGKLHIDVETGTDQIASSTSSTTTK